MHLGRRCSFPRRGSDTVRGECREHAHYTPSFSPAADGKVFFGISFGVFYVKPWRSHQGGPSPYNVFRPPPFVLQMISPHPPQGSLDKILASSFNFSIPYKVLKIQRVRPISRTFRGRALLPRGQKVLFPLFDYNCGFFQDELGPQRVFNVSLTLLRCWVHC